MSLHSNNRPLPRTRVDALAIGGNCHLAVVSFPTGGPRLSDAGLTRAEHSIAEAVVAGQTNAEIAALRGTSARTIANQIASIFRKCGVRSRAELAAMAAARAPCARRRERAAAMEPLDLVGVVEAAYRLDLDEQAWLTRLASAAAPALDEGLGVAAAVFRPNAARAVVLETVVSTGAADTSGFIAESFAAAPPGSTEFGFGVSPGFHTGLERLREQDRPGFTATIEALGRKHGCRIVDHGGVIAADPAGIGVALFAPSGAVVARAEAARAQWSRAAVHLSTALRLRRSLVSGARIEAILDPSGACAHAEPPAASRTAREALRESVRAIEKVRGGAGPHGVGDPLAVWKGLCSGRWSLVDRYESDGRRYVVAMRNESRVRDPRALTERERQVAVHAALGHSNKLIGYALGLAPSTVAWHLSRAARKLGVGSRAELIALVGALVRRPVHTPKREPE